jgi:hypothetical protein
MMAATQRTRGTFDWGLKLLSLAIAMLLWSAYHSEPTVEMSYQGPLEFRNVPSNLEIAGDFPPSVHVRVRGSSTVLRQITPGSLAVVVDLRDAVPGERVLHLSPAMIDPPLGAVVVLISPSEIRLRLALRQPVP